LAPARAAVAKDHHAKTLHGLVMRRTKDVPVKMTPANLIAGQGKEPEMIRVQRNLIGLADLKAKARGVNMLHGVVMRIHLAISKKVSLVRAPGDLTIREITAQARQEEGAVMNKVQKNSIGRGELRAKALRRNSHQDAATKIHQIATTIKDLVAHAIAGQTTRRNAEVIATDLLEKRLAVATPTIRQGEKDRPRFQKTVGRAMIEMKDRRGKVTSQTKVTGRSEKSAVFQTRSSSLKVR
jgi:hypothetical protein